MSDKGVESILSLENLSILIEEYIRVLSELAHKAGWDEEKIVINQKILQSALAEAKSDLDVMLWRRKPKKGVSLAKIAGIVTYRLYRYAPICYSDDQDTKHTDKINLLASLSLGFKSILGINITEIPYQITRELQYLLIRRHMNQETLGVIFETLKAYEN